MKFDEYSKNMAKCLLSSSKIDAVYLFYATDDNHYTVSPSLTAKDIGLVCNDSTNVYRSKSVVCSDITESGISLTVTSSNGEILNNNSPGFTAGVYIYGVAAVVSNDTKTGNVYAQDGLLFYNELTPVPVPAGSTVAMTININLEEA